MGWPRRFYQALQLVGAMALGALLLSSLITLISPELVRGYADALADPNPAYAEATAVPPTLMVSQVFDVQTAGNSDVAPVVFETMKTGVHGEHDLLL